MGRSILRAIGLLAAIALALWLFGLSYRDSIVGGPPAEREAAAAVLHSILKPGTVAADVAACVSYRGLFGDEDFPPGYIDDLMTTFPGLRPQSACNYDSKKMAYAIRGTGKRVTMIACGILSSSVSPPSPSNGVRVECDFVHGGGLDALGKEFEVRRSFLGGTIVQDHGVRWVS
jgi:hypothetical protein